MATFYVQVTQTVEVQLDETKFDADFMAEFTANHFPYDTLEEHAQHLAQLQARGVYEMEHAHRDEFIEGYGPQKGMGIRARVIHTEEELDEASNWVEQP